MPDLSLSQLIGKIQSQKLSRDEASDAFIVKANPLKPFDFLTYVNPETVDVTNLEPLAKNADTLLRSIGGLAPPLKPNTAAAKARAERPSAIAEGDSWFRLPSVVSVPNTCIDFLQQSGYAIRNVAHWGDTLAQILQKGEFWPSVDAGMQPLLFSAGGNDVLGGGHLADFLNQFDVDHAKPGDAAYYVRREFYSNLEAIVATIEKGLILPMMSRRRNCKIIMHGYDYVIPRPDGPWLGSPMQFRGLDPTFNAELCRNIVRLMIDAYGLKLKALAAKYADVFVHLDLRDTIKATEWYDELHGKNAAAQKIAKRIGATLDAIKETAEERAIAKLHTPLEAVA